MGFEAVGIGDLHLTNSAGRGGLSSLIEESDAMVGQSVDRVLEYASRHGIRHVIFYGDICEGPRMSYGAVLELIRILRQDFEFHLILGNHDLFSEDPSAGHSLQIVEQFGLQNVNIYTKPTRRRIDGARINFLPWPHASFIDGVLNVAHVDVDGSRTDSGRANRNESRSDALAVVGHIHTSQKIRNTYYSGTLYQTNFGESGEKFFHHLAHEDGDWSIRLIPFAPEYRLHDVRPESPTELSGLSGGEHDLYKITATNEIRPQHYQHLRVVRLNSGVEASVPTEITGSQVSLSSCEFFRSWLRDQQIEPEMRRAAWAVRRRILES